MLNEHQSAALTLSSLIEMQSISNFKSLQFKKYIKMQLKCLHLVC